MKGKEVYVKLDGSFTTDLKADQTNVRMGWLLEGDAPDDAHVCSVDVDGKLQDVLVDHELRLGDWRD